MLCSLIYAPTEHLKVSTAIFFMEDIFIIIACRKTVRTLDLQTFKQTAKLDWPAIQNLSGSSGLDFDFQKYQRKSMHATSQRNKECEVDNQII